MVNVTPNYLSRVSVPTTQRVAVGSRVGLVHVPAFLFYSRGISTNQPTQLQHKFTSGLGVTQADSDQDTEKGMVQDKLPTETSRLGENTGEPPRQGLRSICQLKGKARIHYV